MKRFFKKDFLLLVTKLIEKIHDPRNVKEQYQSFVGKKPHKISKTIRNNYFSAKNF